jgi:hypothetical protein
MLKIYTAILFSTFIIFQIFSIYNIVVNKRYLNFFKWVIIKDVKNYKILLVTNSIKLALITGLFIYTLLKAPK